jgi:hypothetical protein
MSNKPSANANATANEGTGTTTREVAAQNCSGLTPEQFCYWLQGFAELSPSNVPTPEQWQMIREHLNLVFTKVTPDIGTVSPSVETRIPSIFKPPYCSTCSSTGRSTLLC